MDQIAESRAAEAVAKLEQAEAKLYRAELVIDQVQSYLRAGMVMSAIKELSSHQEKRDERQVVSRQVSGQGN